MTTYVIPTDFGNQWNASAAAGNDVSPVTQMAFGDGDRTPTGAETQLLNEVHRVLVSDYGVPEGETHAFFDGPLPQGVGGFSIREFGLFTADGDMVAIGRRDDALPIREEDDLVYRLEIFYSRLDALTVEVDPVYGVSPSRRIDTGKGLKGGGDFSADRTHELDIDGLDDLADPVAGTDTLAADRGGTAFGLTLTRTLAWFRTKLIDGALPDNERFVRFSDIASKDKLGIFKLFHADDNRAGVLTGDDLYHADDNPTGVVTGDDLPSISSDLSELVPMIQIREQRSNTTVYTLGSWTRRTLNTVVTDDVGATLNAGGAIDLPAGVYRVSASAAANDAGYHVIRLQDVTNAATLAVGIAVDSHTGSSDATAISQLEGRFTLAAPATIELQHTASGNGSYKSGDPSTLPAGAAYTVDAFVTLILEQAL